VEDWNDLKLVLAVHRAGSLTQAAQILAIDHSTAFRRLRALETRLDVRLFERLPGGVYQTTPAGAPGPLAAFRRAHPGIVVELVIENRVLSLSRREADIALRPVRPKEGELWGRKLADMAWALYAAPDYLETQGKLRHAEDIGGHAIIGWEAGTAGIGAAGWLAEHVPPSAFVYRSNSLVNQSIAAKAGVGITLLPCYLGDSETGLARALATPITEIAGELWIVTHVDLKQTARVRAFFDLVGEALIRERDLFEGRRL